MPYASGPQNQPLRSGSFTVEKSERLSIRAANLAELFGRAIEAEGIDRKAALIEKDPFVEQEWLEQALAEGARTGLRRSSVVGFSIDSPEDSISLHSTVSVLSFGERISSDQALQRLEKAGYRAAGVQEMLGLIVQDGPFRLSIEPGRPVVGLENYALNPKERYVPTLSRDNFGLHIAEGFAAGGGWHKHVRFLAIRDFTLRQAASQRGG